MRAECWYFQTSKEDWCQLAQSLYEKKISQFIDFQLIAIKSPAAARASADEKKQKEESLLLKKLQPNDLLIIFDENGKVFSGSIEFAKSLKHHLESGKQKIVFAIGGAYGFGDEVKKRAKQMISLSNLTMNHHVALTVVLEQIYRSFCIHNNLPYHNS